MFGDWFIPAHSKIEHGAGQDFVELGNRLVGKDFARNDQPAFSQLVHGGHYLGWWSAKLDQVPPTACSKIRRALDYRLLYPRWQFLRDFPSSVFDNPARRRPRLKQPVFATIAKDKVTPRFRPRAVLHDDDCAEELTPLQVLVKRVK